MAERKLVRSCLSERLRSDFKENANSHLPRRDVYRQDSINAQVKQWTAKRIPTVDVGSELQAIFSCKPREDFSAVFGCSPPVRATNPLSRDYQFRSCVLVNPNLSKRASLKETREIYAAVMPEI
ncbi:hypothetical protein BSKO_08706 [Bryopsis sp. KO-2023]|nr:hypothetical protein BSKO_08706 [Bryopsis sp. KO-2023]